MKYVIESNARYAVGDDKFKTHTTYFEKTGNFMPFPHFGKKESAMQFKSKKEARNKLREIGRKEGNRYKIVKA